MNEHEWIKTRFDSLEGKIKDIKHLMKNHLQHHFIFTMGALAAAVAIAVALIKVVWGSS